MLNLITALYRWRCGILLFALKQDKTLIHYVPGYHIAFRCFSLGRTLDEAFKRILDEKEIKCFDFSLGTQNTRKDGLMVIPIIIHLYSASGITPLF